jgi:Tol biopolymer transport system component
MKKLLMGSVALCLFSVSITLFTISCQKQASAQTSTGVSQQNKLIFKKVIGTTAEIWTANYDGTSSAKINIILPAGVVFSDDMNPVISPNGQKIFFTAGTSFAGDIYSCNVDGSSVSKIVDKGGTSNNIILGSAY